jgi:hypothetical protein
MVWTSEPLRETLSIWIGKLETAACVVEIKKGAHINTTVFLLSVTHQGSLHLVRKRRTF